MKMKMKIVNFFKNFNFTLLSGFGGFKGFLHFIYIYSTFFIISASFFFICFFTFLSFLDLFGFFDVIRNPPPTNGGMWMGIKIRPKVNYVMGFLNRLNLQSSIYLR